MYPVQNYCQCYPQYANPYSQPQVNAVKIDINNPQAYGGVNHKGQVNPPLPMLYNYPTSSMYAMPQVPQYTTVGAYPQPPIMAQQQTVIPQAPQPLPTAVTVPMATPQTVTNTQQTQVVTPAPVMPQVIQQPIPQAAPQVINNTQTTSIAPAPAVAPAPVVVPAPVVAQSQMVAPMPVVPTVPVVPAPAFVQPPAINAPVTQTVNVNPSIPGAVVDTKQNTTVAPVKPVEAQTVQTTQTAGIDVNGILTALSSANPDDQTAAIQKIAEVAQTNPVAAKALLNEQVFGQLVNVINADSSKLQGPANGKPDPKNLSPLEKAEINKQFAVYTLAILQKNFREEINKEMKKNNLPDIAINDIPYIKEGIVNNLKDNPNPTIREACLSALNYIGKPEDKEVLKVLYDISAKHDASPAVKAAAKDYLSKIPA